MSARRLGWAGAAALALSVLALPGAQGQEGPPPLIRGSYLAADGQVTPLVWTTQRLLATATEEALRLEVEPGITGTAETAPLPLAPLRLYTLNLTCRRGPGTRLDVVVAWREADGRPEQRLMVWQLPDCFRVNYWPLSARRTTYAQRVCLPPGATQPTVQVSLTGHPEADYNYFDLYALEITTGAEVPFGERLGPNLCPGGDMEQVNAAGMAQGWGFWGADPGAQAVEKDAQGRAAHGGRRYLSFPAGTNCLLVDGVIPVEAGRAYRVSYWARGKGSINAGVQSLEATQGQRVADAQRYPVLVDTEEWQQFSYTWFAESLWLDAANLFLGIGTQTELDLDDVTFQLVEP